jgi:hypothetical protein
MHDRRTRCNRKGSSDKPKGLSLRRIGRGAKVKLAVNMTSTLYEVTMDSIRGRHPGISKPKLFQLTRRRIQRRPPIWMEDVVPYSAEPEKSRLSDLARKWKMTNRDAEEMLKGLKRFWARWNKGLALR